MNTLTIRPEPPNNHMPRGIHPHRFALWVGMAAMTMLFAALTSAYLVRQAAGQWVEFQIPKPFFFSAFLLLLSSATIWQASKAFNRYDLPFYRISLSLTLLLGIAFCISQYLGWRELQRIGIYLEGNPSGSFVYVISYIHIVHVGMGLLLLTGSFLRAITTFRHPTKWQWWHLHPDKKIRIELLATYWHFVDLLWLYLLGFFYYFR